MFRALRLRCDALSSVPMQILDKQDNEVEWPFPTPLRSLIWKWEASALLNGAAYGEPINNRSRYTKDVHFRNSYDMNVQYAGNGIMEFKQNSSGATWTNDIYNGQYELQNYYMRYRNSQKCISRAERCLLPFWELKQQIRERLIE